MLTKMEKVTVLKYIQDFMISIGLSFHRITDNKIFFNLPTTYFIILVMICLFTLGSGLGAYEYWPELLLMSGPMIQCSGSTQVVGMFYSVGARMNYVKSLHLMLQAIVDEGNLLTQVIKVFKNGCFINFLQIVARSSDAYQIYLDVEQKCTIFAKRMLSYIIIHQSMFIFSLCHSIYCLSVGNYDTSTWQLAFKLAVPFSTEKVWKWYILYILQQSFGTAYALSLVPIPIYFFCCCFYIGAICDHFDFLINSIKRKAKELHEEENPFIRPKITNDIRKLFAETVVIHNKILE